MGDRPADLLPPHPSERSARHDRIARAVVLEAVKRFARGRIAIVEDGCDSDGRCDRIPGADVTVTVHDRATYAELIANGSVGLGVCYAYGLWDCEDLVELIRIATRSLPGARGPTGRLRRVLRPAKTSLRRTGPSDARLDVQRHYDLGENFFELFLDETLTYSCGYYESAGATLRDAQIAKNDRICKKLRLGPGDRLVEIGTGWGSFAVHAASRYGCDVTTTTISDRQYEHACRKARDSGLDDRVTVRNDDFRNIEGSFDKLVSIEMIEALDWRAQSDFLEACGRLVSPGGLVGLQAIVIDDRLFEKSKRSRDFITDVVFPGSCIPSVGSIVKTTSSSTDLSVIGLEDIGSHYTRTLEEWRRNFARNRDRVIEIGFDEPFVRMWDLYLAYCQAGFVERRISDVQMVLAKPDWRESPGVPK